MSSLTRRFCNHRHGLLLQSLTAPGFTSHRFFLSEATPTDHPFKFTTLLQQCRGCIRNVKKLHGLIIVGGYERNPIVATKLIGNYAELGSSNLDDARNVFDNLCERDVFCCNMMIQAYANVGSITSAMEALNVYIDICRRGVLGNEYTFTFVVKAFGVLKDGKSGSAIHGNVVQCGFDGNVCVGNALVAFYAKCGDVEASRRVFDEMPEKDLVSWNSIIAGYTSNGHAEEALGVFRNLLHDGLISGPDYATFVTILPACAQASAIGEGLWIHSCIVKRGLDVDGALGSGLISMYGNCGRLTRARLLFDRINEKTIVVWNAIIRCYGMHGDAEEALALFSQFLESGLQPDGILFLCLLSMCSHAGLVAKGREIFKQMVDYGFERGNEHYACMVDLLGRAGFLLEAVEMIETMPMQPGKDVYAALLTASRMNNDIGLAELVAEKLFRLDPTRAGGYVNLAKMYEDAGRWEEAARVRKAMKENNIKKPFGCSSVEVDSVFHTFGVEDEAHQRSVEIFDALETVYKAMEEEAMGLRLSE